VNDTNREWVLTTRPVGAAKPQDFLLRRNEVPDPSDLSPGQILVHNTVFLHAPTMRNWMDAPGNNYYPSVDLGAPMLATCAGEVLASADDRFPAGMRVTTIGSWQDYSVIDATVMPVRPVRDDMSLVDAMGPVGMNALTAYMGMLKVGQPEPGETVVVSGAAGSTGSVAGQIARITGCRVIGIAGSDEKCAYLTGELGFDAAINYRTDDVEARMRAEAPNGINVFFDNVGGVILQAAVENIAKFGRVVLCGQIAGYDGSTPIPGPSNMMRLVYGSVRMQGFLLGDFEADIPAARDQLWDWVVAGQLRHREDIRHGFENLPATFGDLSRGANDGTLLVVTDDEAAHRKVG
jgi:NADPH-dependent curcumin reductase CurA